MTFYERLESLRKSKKISQGDLEKELGFSNGSISKWKKSQPTFDRLKRLADYFGVTVEYLLNGEKNDTIDGYYLNIETAQAAQEMFEKDKILFDVYKSADKDRLIEYAKRLKALRDLEEGN